ncbi:MAG TPA: sulfotransferase [Acidimicrobiia bacterium]
MELRVPQVPVGVRPVVGSHLTRIELPRATREWRRAVNLAVVAGMRARQRRVALPAAPAYPKLFVVGCPRSGTSWVQGVLSAHPSVITSSESHAYENIYDPVVRRGRKSVVAWTKVLHRHDLAEREARWVGLHWWVNRATLCHLIEWALSADGVSAADAAESVVEAVFDSYFLDHGGDEHKTMLEKTPGHLVYARQILRRFPEARIVEVLRDGRDVCVSMQMQALTMSWPPKTRRDQIAAWVSAVRRGLELRSDPEFADRVHLVRYEELKAAPEDEIARLFEFSGLDADARLIAEVADRSDFRHQSSTGAGRHTRRGEVGDWRNHFDADEEVLFRELAGDVFESVGYRF